MKNRQRFYAHVPGPGKNKVEQIIRESICTENKFCCVSRIVVLSDDIAGANWFAAQFGEDGKSKLLDGEPLPGSHVIVNFESPNTYHTVANEILITINLESDEILLLDDKPGINTIIALQWFWKSAEKWVRITNAINIENNTKAKSFALLPCIVIKALEALTASIDMATGLEQSFDDRLAKTYLRTLEEYKVLLQEEEIESYLIKHLDWTKGHVIGLIEIIRKINNGEPFEGGGKMKYEWHINKWKQDCNEQQTTTNRKFGLIPKAFLGSESHSVKANSITSHHDLASIDKLH